MKWYEWDVLGDYADPKHSEYYHADSETDPAGIALFCLMEGRRVDIKYPNHGEVRLRLDDDFPGLLPCSYLPNAGNFLPCCKELAECILRHRVGETEIIPFLLINHRGRVQSRDYVFVNPIYTFDAINIDGSTIKRHKDGSIMKIKNLVLDAAKLNKAPDLFRLQEEPSTYLCSETLANAIHEQKFTNIGLMEVEVK